MKITTCFHIACIAWALLLAMITGVGLLAPTRAYAAFGLTNSGGALSGGIYTGGTNTVDTGAGLVFRVDQNGGMNSINYNGGAEMQDQTKSSAIASGFFVYGADTMTVTAATIGGNIIMLTVTDTSPTGITGGQLIHYYIVQQGVNNIYMATWMTAEPGVGELRYIMRLLDSQLPYTPVPSDLTGTTTTIESTDVFGMPNGQTRSKYYDHDQAMNLSVRGVTGTNVGVYMMYGSRESSSGGPFYRDIQNQTTGVGGDAELYNYMNSGHEQTEAVRTNVLYGPYVYAFTNGSAPTTPDLSFIANLGLMGYVNAAGRGSVAIAGITGRDTTTLTQQGTPYAYTVAFANTTAQYWATADPSTGAAVCAGMKPGTYTMTIYKGELAVYTTTVSVTAGSVTSLSTIPITADPSSLTPIWRIGDWDGMPNEFLNSDKMINMHPSDSRITTWSPGTYVVGASSPFTGYPCYQWKGVGNGAQSVQFKLTTAEVAALTLRIGVTDEYAGGRPNITVNSYTPKTLPSASTQPDSRSMTVGTYRGNNTMYTYGVPASAFIAGTNTLTINPISGSSGTTYLSPGYSMDAVDLLAPANTIGGVVTLQGWGGAPQPLTVTLTPTGTTGGSVSTQTVTPYADGSFLLTNVPVGTYTLGIKGARWLKKDIAISTVTGSVANLSVTLLGGDVNGDNMVTASDMAAVRAAYGTYNTTPAMTNWNANADLNGDGQVAGADLAIVRANYGKAGDP